LAIAGVLSALYPVMTVVLAAILCLPLFTRVLGSRAWFWVCGALWLSLVPFWILMPELKYLIYVSVPLRHPHL
jgi:hypothetical protein